MTGVRLRPARAEDAVPCARILGAFFTETAWLPRLHTPTEDLAFLRHLIGGNGVTVADKGGVAVGYMAMDGGQIRHLYLDRSVRGQGIGSAMIEAAKARQAQLWLWCFQANVDALRFYARHGFVVTDETDGAKNEEGVPDARLDWRR